MQPWASTKVSELSSITQLKEKGKTYPLLASGLPEVIWDLAPLLLPPLTPKLSRSHHGRPLPIAVLHHHHLLLLIIVIVSDIRSIRTTPTESDEAPTGPWLGNAGIGVAKDLA